MACWLFWLTESCVNWSKMGNTKNTLSRSAASDSSGEIPRKIQFCNASGQTSRERKRESGCNNSLWGWQRNMKVVLGSAATTNCPNFGDVEEEQEKEVIIHRGFISAWGMTFIENISVVTNTKTRRQCYCNGTYLNQNKGWKWRTKEAKRFAFPSILLLSQHYTKKNKRRSRRRAHFPN